MSKCLLNLPRHVLSGICDFLDDVTVLVMREVGPVVALIKYYNLPFLRYVNWQRLLSMNFSPRIEQTLPSWELSKRLVIIKCLVVIFSNSSILTTPPHCFQDNGNLKLIMTFFDIHFHKRHYLIWKMFVISALGKLDIPKFFTSSTESSVRFFTCINHGQLSCERSLQTLSITLMHEKNEVRRFLEYMKPCIMRTEFNTIVAKEISSETTQMFSDFLEGKSISTLFIHAGTID